MTLDLTCDLQNSDWIPPLLNPFYFNSLAFMRSDSLQISFWLFLWQRINTLKCTYLFLLMEASVLPVSSSIFSLTSSVFDENNLAADTHLGCRPAWKQCVIALLVAALYLPPSSALLHFPSSLLCSVLAALPPKWHQTLENAIKKI